MYGQVQDSGPIAVLPLMCTSAIQGHHPVLSRLSPLRVAAVAEGLAVGSPFVSVLSSLRVHCVWGWGGLCHGLMAETSFVY